MDNAIFLDLSERAKFRITGTDRLRFLNGQITNDLRKASETSAIEACILNAKGKTDAHIFVCTSEESVWVDAAADLRETLKVRLERYVIADIKMSGQTNKRLCGLISVDDIPLQPGMKLVAPSVPGKEVGWITSATRSETIEKEIALGYVKRGFNSAGTRLAVFAMEDSEPTPVGAIAIEVFPLPFL